MLLRPWQQYNAVDSGEPLFSHVNGITGINEVNALVNIELPESLNWSILLD